MEAAAPATSKVSLKLMINPKDSGRVLFAEAGKEFVDFLFYILALPVGTFIPLLNQEIMGSLGNIYDSIANISTTYLRPNVNKDSLLMPKAYFSSGTEGFPLQLPNVESSRKLYKCCRNVSERKGICECGSSLSQESKYIGPPSANNLYSSNVGDYVKGKVTYMVMDDLAVKPLSTTSLATLLNKFNVKDIGALEEKVVDLGVDEVCVSHILCFLCMTIILFLSSFFTFLFWKILLNKLV